MTTATPDDVHEALIESEDFIDFLTKLDRAEVLDGFREVVEAQGEMAESLYPHDLEELQKRELGYLRVAWEAYHWDRPVKEVKS